MSSGIVVLIFLGGVIVGMILATLAICYYVSGKWRK